MFWFQPQLQGMLAVLFLYLFIVCVCVGVVVVLEREGGGGTAFGSSRFCLLILPFSLKCLNQLYKMMKSWAVFDFIWWGHTIRYGNPSSSFGSLLRWIRGWVHYTHGYLYILFIVYGNQCQIWTWRFVMKPC